MNMQDFSCYVSPVQQNILKTNVLQKIYIYIFCNRLFFTRVSISIYIYTHSRSMCPSMFLIYVPYLYLHHSMYILIPVQPQKKTTADLQFFYICLFMFHIFIYLSYLCSISISTPQIFSSAQQAFLQGQQGGQRQHQHQRCRHQLQRRRGVRQRSAVAREVGHHAEVVGRGHGSTDLTTKAALTGTTGTTGMMIWIIYDDS